MKALRGTASALVPATREQCFALIEAVDRYPEWHPEVVRSVEVVEWDAGGVPSRARTELHVAVGPLTQNFDLLMAVRTESPASVTIAKVGGSAKFDVVWRLQGGESTRVSLELDANLDVPPLLPLGGVGDSVARGFVSAASAELARRARS